MVEIVGKFIIWKGMWDFFYRSGVVIFKIGYREWKCEKIIEIEFRCIIGWSENFIFLRIICFFDIELFLKRISRDD